MNNEYTTIRVFKADRDRLAKLEKPTGQISIPNPAYGEPYTEMENTAQVLQRILIEWELLVLRDKTS